MVVVWSEGAELLFCAAQYLCPCVQVPACSWRGATSPSCTNAFGIVCTVGLQACGTFDQEVWNGVEVL